MDILGGFSSPEDQKINGSSRRRSGDIFTEEHSPCMIDSPSHRKSVDFLPTDRRAFPDDRLIFSTKVKRSLPWRSIDLPKEYQPIFSQKNNRSSPWRSIYFLKEWQSIFSQMVPLSEYWWIEWSFLKRSMDHIREDRWIFSQKIEWYFLRSEVFFTEDQWKSADFSHKIRRISLRRSDIFPEDRWILFQMNNRSSLRRSIDILSG